MLRRVVGRVAVCLLVACSGAAPAPPAPPAPRLPPPVVPTPPAPPVRRADLAELPRDAESPLGAAAWQERHAALLRAPERKGAELVVLGDGIADGWCGSRSFQKQWRKRKPLNLAIAGDQAQQLLWRIEHGALDGLSPKLVIVAVGSENVAHGFAPADAARGVAAVVSQVRARLPASRVLVLGLLPAGQAASDPRRAAITHTNTELARLGEPGHVQVSDAGGVFLNADGSISAQLMGDFVTPTALGYEALTITVSLVAQQLLEGR
jgi:lysophospholipase L1-like esterase